MGLGSAVKVLLRGFGSGFRVPGLGFRAQGFAPRPRVGIWSVEDSEEPSSQKYALFVRLRSRMALSISPIVISAHEPAWKARSPRQKRGEVRSLAKSARWSSA